MKGREICLLLLALVAVVFVHNFIVLVIVDIQYYDFGLVKRFQVVHRTDILKF